MHDLLAFLAEQMMALNRHKRATAKQFLTDLKDFHGLDARTLNPKTKLDQFWKLEAAQLFAHLRKNVRTLAAQNIRLAEADEEKIRRRFLKATEAIVLLEAQTTFTDQLIDQIVYRLYGLTPEEVKIAEEAVPSPTGFLQLKGLHGHSNFCRCIQRHSPECRYGRRGMTRKRLQVEQGGLPRQIVRVPERSRCAK